MQIYTLVGKSGTGKSFHAMDVCSRYNIESIIDDGLFIYKNTVMAGTSAKKADTKIGAVKVALFIDDKQRDSVKEQIEKCKPNAILILGTSKGMVDKIIARLGLPKLTDDSPNRISIEGITTEAERARARQLRERTAVAEDSRTGKAYQPDNTAVTEERLSNLRSYQPSRGMESQGRPDFYPRSPCGERP